MEHTQGVPAGMDEADLISADLNLIIGPPAAPSGQEADCTPPLAGMPLMHAVDQIGRRGLSQSYMFGTGAFLPLGAAAPDTAGLRRGSVQSAGSVVSTTSSSADALFSEATGLALPCEGAGLALPVSMGGLNDVQQQPPPLPQQLDKPHLPWPDHKPAALPVGGAAPALSLAITPASPMCLPPPQRRQLVVAPSDLAVAHRPVSPMGMPGTPGTPGTPSTPGTPYTPGTPSSMPSTPGTPGTPLTPGTSATEAAERRRQRNKEHARRSRDRQKKHTQNLEQQVAALKLRNQQLEAHYKMLQDNAMRLKAMIEERLSKRRRVMHAGSAAAESTGGAARPLTPEQGSHSPAPTVVPGSPSRPPHGQEAMATSRSAVSTVGQVTASAFESVEPATSVGQGGTCGPCGGCPTCPKQEQAA